MSNKKAFHGNEEKYSLCEIRIMQNVKIYDFSKILAKNLGFPTSDICHNNKSYQPITVIYILKTSPIPTDSCGIFCFFDMESIQVMGLAKVPPIPFFFKIGHMR